MDRCISWQAWLGIRRQRWLEIINRFIVENDRSAVAVPTGSINSFRTTVENIGNIAAFSAETARDSTCCLDRDHAVNVFSISVRAELGFGVWRSNCGGRGRKLAVGKTFFCELHVAFGAF